MKFSQIQTCFWPQLLTWYLPSKSHSGAAYSMWSFWVRNWTFFSVQWLPDWPELPERLLFLTYFVIQTSTPSLQVTSFHQDVNQWLDTRGGIFASKCKEVFSLNRKGNPDWQEVAKVTLVETYLDRPTHPSQNLQRWILP